MCAGKLGLFDNFVREREEIVRRLEAKRLGGLEVDHQLELEIIASTLHPDFMRRYPRRRGSKVLREVLLGLLALAGLSISTAQAAEPTGTLMLACQGTVTDNSQADPKPEPISMGIIIDFTARTVQGFGSYWPIPIPIDTVTETAVMFMDSHQNGIDDPVISGTIDRITGDTEVRGTSEVRGS
jgi:hypothetical protein